MVVVVGLEDIDFGLEGLGGFEVGEVDGEVEVVVEEKEEVVVVVFIFSGKVDFVLDWCFLELGNGLGEGEGFFFYLLGFYFFVYFKFWLYLDSFLFLGLFDF